MKNQFELERRNRTKPEQIVIVTTYTYPSAMATAARVDFFARSALGAGVKKVTVVGPGEDATKFSESRLRNLQIMVTSRPGKSSNLIIRGIQEFYHGLKTLFILSAYKQGVFILTIPSPGLLLVAIRLRKQSYALDVRDTVWDYLIQQGGFKKWLGLAIRSLFRVAAQKSKLVSVTNSRQAEIVHRDAGVAAVVIPNGISKAKLDKIAQIPTHHRASSPALLFAGNIGVAQGLGLLLDLAERMPQILVKIAGQGSGRESLLRESQKRGLTNVHFLGTLEWESLLAEYSNASILYAQIVPEYASAIPTKVFEYLALGLPVVLGLPLGPARKEFSSFSGVFIHEPGDLIGLCEAIRKSLADPKVDRARNLKLLESFHLRDRFQNDYASRLFGKI